MGHNEARQNLRRRAEEVSREIGVLTVVFVPIDFVLAADRPEHPTWLLILLLFGCMMLGGAVAAEYWRIDAS